MALEIDYDELFDDDGYPTEYALELVADFEGTPRALVEFIQQLWRPNDSVVIDHGQDNITVTMVTIGWSGNESIISALDTTFFRMRFWESIYRGGKYVYEIRKEEWEGTTLVGKLP